MKPAIEATGLRKTYPPNTRALDGIDFAVREGTVFGLLGPNGAGKSTTVKVLTTLTRPDEGSASVAGIDVLAEPKRVRRAIGVVHQRTGTVGELTGRENLALQGRLFGLRGRAGLARRVDELLEAFGLPEAADRVVKGYSGGMVRRLDIAIGLIQHPEVLFLDEPTTGLDPEIRAAMWEEIRQLRSESGLTILLTTHYLEEADQLADDIAIVDRGRVVARGTPDELKAELEGDTVQVELAEAQSNGRVPAALEGIGRIRELRLEDRAVHARVEDGAAALPAIVGALGQAGVEVATATMARPSLDDVYLRYTGRSFAEAERSEKSDTKEGEAR
jgi:ABC-2 type transport system ATP-binding protein